MPDDLTPYRTEAAAIDVPREGETTAPRDGLLRRFFRKGKRVAAAGVRAGLGDRGESLAHEIETLGGSVASIRNSREMLGLEERIDVIKELSHGTTQGAEPRHWEDVMRLPLKRARQVLQMVETALADREAWAAVLQDCKGLLLQAEKEVEALDLRDHVKRAAKVEQDVRGRNVLDDMRSLAGATLNRVFGLLKTLADAADGYPAR